MIKHILVALMLALASMTTLVACKDAGGAASSADFKVGDKVDVNWKGVWWQGTVLAVTGDAIKVHYTGWNQSWDENVTKGRLRPWHADTQRGKEVAE